MEKPRLLVTASTFPRWEGDTEPRFVLDLCKKLTAYFEVTVLAPGAPGAAREEVLEGVHVVRYHYFPIHKWETLCYPGAIVPRIREKKVRVLLVPFLFFALWWKVGRMKKQFDVAHAHWLIPQGIVQSFHKIPYLVTGHGGDVTSLNVSIMRMLKKRCIKNAGAVTAVSDALLLTMNQICPKEQTAVVSMGCDMERFGTQYRIEDYFEQGEEQVVLFVGRLAEKKGVTYLIEAMKNVEAKLVIVGDGDLYESLFSQASESFTGQVLAPEEKPVDTGWKIRFLGAKTHEELKTIYASADVFAMPSVTAKDGDKEGFGVVMLEAMASGLVVAASNSGGITDVIQDGENGLLMEEKNCVAIAEKLNELLTQKDLYQKLQKKAFATAQQYDYSVIAESYRELIMGVMGHDKTK